MSGMKLQDPNFNLTSIQYDTETQVNSKLGQNFKAISQSNKKKGSNLSRIDESIIRVTADTTAQTDSRMGASNYDESSRAQFKIVDSADWCKPQSLDGHFFQGKQKKLQKFMRGNQIFQEQLQQIGLGEETVGGLEGDINDMGVFADFELGAGDMEAAGGMMQDFGDLNGDGAGAADIDEDFINELEDEKIIGLNFNHELQSSVVIKRLNAVLRKKKQKINFEKLMDFNDKKSEIKPNPALMFYQLMLRVNGSDNIQLTQKFDDHGDGERFPNIKITT